MTSSSHRRTAAFTLIELLVVVGVISVLVGVIGVALKDGNPGAALQSGQSTLVSLLANARGQAALNQTNAMIIVDVTPNPDGSIGDNYLRAFQVVYESTTNPGKWVKTGDIVKLPQGVYLVPKTTAALPAVTLGAAGVAWSEKRVSTSIQAGAEAKITWEASTTDTNLYLKLNAYTQFGTTPAGQIVLAAGQRTSASAIALPNPEAVRGVVLSKYGIATVVNDEGASFD